MNGCNGKRPYETRQLAEAAKRVMLGKDRRDATRMNVWQCRNCAKFHIGHERKAYGTGTPDHRRDSYQARRKRYWDLVRDGT